MLKSLGDLRRPLASRDFRLVFGGRLVSEMGDWAARLALMVLVLSRSHSVFLTAVVAAASQLAWLGPGQFLAVRLHRFSWRAQMIGADALRAGLFALMLLRVPTGVLIGMAILAGLGGPVFETARAALILDIVPTDSYPDAMAIASASYELTSIGGYLLGGLAIAAVGAGAALAANAASFAFSALMVLGVKEPARHHQPLAPRPHLREGFRILRGDPLLLRVAVVTAAGGFAVMAVGATAPTYARSALGRSPAFAGVLLAAMSAASLAGMSLIRRDGSALRMVRRSVVVGGLASAVGLVGFVLGHLSGGLVGFCGCGLVSASWVPAQGAVGPRIPRESRIATFGLLQGSLRATDAAGAWAGGLVAAFLGVSPMAVGAMVLVALLSVAGFARPAAGYETASVER